MLIKPWVKSSQSQQSSRSAVIETSEEYFNEVLRL